ncbi:nurim homolog [Toxorhynchites rutilus septentrionalis]|uniref:nurim homolog n=1 Tax=Toxorhynchites rutilus septentrionalis TaxID=329112 RepID=UPI00247AAAF0|nr:nurim homolog [Toxorhynchites rutilus septentrionalis]
MLSLRQLVCFILSLLSFISVFYSVGKLGVFLATPVQRDFKHVLLNNLLDDRSLLKATLFSLFFNSIWIILFVIQHSAMKSDTVKAIWRKMGLELAERSIYNIASSYCLLILLKNWKSMQSYQLWYIEVQQSSTLWWTFVSLHIISWVIIYGGSLLMDLPEFIGLKQIYYDINDLAPPMSYKSQELRNFYGRMRHPSFVGLSVVLWITNSMSADRLLLAVIWTTYMYLSWNTNKTDLEYQKYQLSRKRVELAKVKE